MSTLHTSAAERASSQCVNLIRGVSLRSPAASAAHLAASPDLYDLAAVLQDRLAQPPAPPSDPYDMEAVAALLDMGSDSEGEISPPSATVTVTHTALTVTLLLRLSLHCCRCCSHHCAAATRYCLVQLKSCCEQDLNCMLETAEADLKRDKSKAAEVTSRTQQLLK